jgi:predicted nuclease with TOPRIM domain
MQEKTSLIDMSKLFPFFKANWKYFGLTIVTILVMLFLQKEKISLTQQLQSTRSAYEERINQIEIARKEERRQNDEALLQLKKKLADVQKQYDDAKVELEKKKKEEIKDLVEKYADDPEELAKKLSEVTGFKIILPE